jgi:hypothetical protein
MTILVIVADPGVEAVAVRIEPSLKVLQTLVGGHIEAVHFRFGSGSNLYFYCNEDGKRLELPINFSLGSDHVVGSIVISSADADGEEVGITEDQAPLVLRAIDRMRGIVKQSRSYVKENLPCTEKPN